jgi:hypothetical protein
MRGFRLCQGVTDLWMRLPSHLCRTPAPSHLAVDGVFWLWQQKKVPFFFFLCPHKKEKGDSN